jgi:hypothetical protein
MGWRVGFSGGMGDWEGRIDSDERSKAEERTLVGDGVGEGSGSVPVKGQQRWVVAREGEEAYMMRDWRGILWRFEMGCIVNVWRAKEGETKVSINTGSKAICQLTNLEYEVSIVF